MPDEPAPAPEPEPSFEQALGQLERIVASLERGEPELTAALAKYEKGVLLLTQCHRLLDQAEQSVALLTGVDEEGNPLTARFDAAATIGREATSAAPISPDAGATPLAKRKSSGRPSTPKSSPPTLDDPASSSDPPF
jgi:exodeoxyribonuclease VII small subunit